MEKDMKIGICLWEYRRRYPLKEAAKQLFADGYEAIDFSELHNVKGPFYTEDESKVKALLEEEAKILADAGIKISQIHGPWRYPPEDGTAQARAEWLSLMERAARMATYLGTPYMVVHPLMPFGADSPENPAEVLRINTEHYARLCDYAKEIGVGEIHLLPYHRLGSDKYKGLGRNYEMGHIDLIPKEKIEILENVAKSAGLVCRIGG